MGLVTLWIDTSPTLNWYKSYIVIYWEFVYETLFLLCFLYFFIQDLSSTSQGNKKSYLVDFLNVYCLINIYNSNN